MEKRKLGNTGIEISAVAIGTSPIAGGVWWGEVDDDESIRTLRAAFDGGINFIDTAPSYGFGHAEEIVGRAIREIPRDQIVLTSKCGLWWEDDTGTPFLERDGHEVKRNLSERTMEIEINNSLKRLGTDYIDLYLVHIQPKEPNYRSPEEIAHTFKRFISEGKIRAVGICNVSVRGADEYQKHIDLALIQNKYSILDRRSEKELIPYCKEHNITFQGYSPLEKGMLTGKRDYSLNVTEKTRETTEWFLPEKRKFVYDMLDSWEDLCKKYSCDISNLATAWVMAQGENVNVLCGARKVTQAEKNAKSGSVRLDAADMLRMREDADRAILLSK